MTDTPSLLTLPTSNAEERAIAVRRYGAKGTNLATLYQRIPRALQLDGYLIPVSAYSSTKRLASVKGADLIDGVRVRSERNSSVEYIAAFDFSFSPKGVRDLLRREGIPFTDEQATPITLVPV